MHWSASAEKHDVPVTQFLVPASLSILTFITLLQRLTFARKLISSRLFMVLNVHSSLCTSELSKKKAPIKLQLIILYKLSEKDSSKLFLQDLHLVCFVVCRNRVLIAKENQLTNQIYQLIVPQSWSLGSVHFTDVCMMSLWEFEIWAFLKSCVKSKQFYCCKRKRCFHWPSFGPTALLSDLYGPHSNCPPFLVSQSHLVRQNTTIISHCGSVFHQVLFTKAIKSIHTNCYPMTPFLAFQSP